MPSQHKVLQYSGHVFACKGCGKNFNPPTTASTDTTRLCVASLTTGIVFATSPCGARTTIEEIILNLNCGGRRMVLASSRKRADILYFDSFSSFKFFSILFGSSFSFQKWQFWCLACIKGRARSIPLILIFQDDNMDANLNPDFSHHNVILSQLSIDLHLKILIRYF